MSGPAISNTLILNQLISELYKNKYDYVICQITANKKLDIEINEHNTELMEKDPLRNFSYKGYWPSSVSTKNEAKQLYYRYLYSPKLEQEDTILKLIQLQTLCRDNNTKLFIMQGYNMNWTNDLINMVDMDKKFVIEDHYKQHKLYAQHDFTNQNTVPNKFYQIELAKHINKHFLKWDSMEQKLERFNV